MSEKFNGLNHNEDENVNKDNIIDEVMNIFIPQKTNDDDIDRVVFSSSDNIEETLKNNIEETLKNNIDEIKYSFEYSPLQNENNKEQINNINIPTGNDYKTEEKENIYRENHTMQYQNNHMSGANIKNGNSDYSNLGNNHHNQNQYANNNTNQYRNPEAPNNGYGYNNYNQTSNMQNQQNYNGGYSKNNQWVNNNTQPNNNQQYYNGYNHPSSKYRESIPSAPYDSYLNSHDPNKADWSYQNDVKKMQEKLPDKKVKKEKIKNPNGKGIKVFAFVMSMLFVFSAITFAGYVIWSESANNNQNNTANSDIVDNNTNSGGLQLNQDRTPEKNNSQNVTGALRPDEIYKKVAPSVVGIAVYTKGVAYQLAGQGSGIIMKSDGYIITNAHVVQDTTNKVDIAKIEVILSTGETYEASLVGADIETDLAVIKIDATGLPEATFGDSAKLSVGDSVLVIGNPNGVEYAGSLTQGVVSALNRNVYMNQLGATLQYIQTDAAINPGNSGGAFINEYGQVVGISSAKLVITGFEGMGFAIPINNAKPIVDSIIENGYVKGRVKIGIFYEPVPKVLAELNGIPEGLRVVQFDGEPDAKKQGVRVGDIITKMDGVAVKDADTISKTLEGKKPGDNLKLSIFRVNGETGRGTDIEINIKLEEKKPANIEG